MLPATGEKLHVRSSRVLVAGRAVPATVEIELRPRGPMIRAIQLGGGGGDAVDLGDAVIAPAPLDLHFHGAGGHAVPPAGSASDIDDVLARASIRADWSERRVAPAYEWLATLPIPQRPAVDPVAHVAAAARAIAAESGTACVGLRIEGLFLSPARAGVWPPEGLRDPDPRLLEELARVASECGSALRIVDVAPELPGALELIERATELGIVASLAHTDATWEQAGAAIDRGARLATHAWNAMRPVGHRDPGVVAAVLADPRVTCELICDGVHLHPGAIALSAAACGRGGWVAISDASPYAGAPAGKYRWAGTTVTHDGVALRDTDGRLAGSAALLDAAMPVLRASGTSDLDAVVAIGAAPRRVLDPGRALGLQAGDPAWIVGAWPEEAARRLAAH